MRKLSEMTVAMNEVKYESIFQINSRIIFFSPLPPLIDAIKKHHKGNGIFFPTEDMLSLLGINCDKNATFFSQKINGKKHYF